jgi:hypothetical protein
MFAFALPIRRGANNFVLPKSLFTLDEIRSHMCGLSQIEKEENEAWCRMFRKQELVDFSSPNFTRFRLMRQKTQRPNLVGTPEGDHVCIVVDNSNLRENINELQVTLMRSVWFYYMMDSVAPVYHQDLAPYIYIKSRFLPEQFVGCTASEYPVIEFRAKGRVGQAIMIEEVKNNRPCPLPRVKDVQIFK